MISRTLNDQAWNDALSVRSLTTVRVTQIQRAVYLRANMTGVEKRLWYRLRAKQLGVKFRRQHPIGPYIVDFACVRGRLAVEIDGDTHDDAYDARRDAWLGMLGWRVMRVVLQEIDEELDDVVGAIEFELQNPGTMLRFEQRSGDLLLSTPPNLPSKAGEEQAPTERPS